jgi:hypothetical protein
VPRWRRPDFEEGLADRARAAEILCKTVRTLQRMHDDPFMAIASKVEKVTSLAEVENIAKASVDAAGFNFFALGGAVVRALELFPTAQSEFPEYKNAREYIERGLGIEYTKALRAAQVYRRILELKVPYSAFKGIGWSKILKLLDLVTKDTVTEWVDKAKAMNTLSLDEAIKAAKAPKALTGEVVEMTVTTKTFKLHPDQKQLVNDALKKASDETGSAMDTVNLEAICQNYIAMAPPREGPTSPAVCQRHPIPD